MSDSMGIETLFKQAMSNLRKEKYESAIDLLSQILEQDPNHNEGLYQRARIRYAIGNTVAAIQDLSTLLEINSEHKLGRFKRLEYTMTLWRHDFEMLKESFPEYCKQFYTNKPETWDLPSDTQVFINEFLEFIQFKANHAETLRDYMTAVEYWQVYHDCGGMLDWTSEDVVSHINWLKQKIEKDDKGAS